MHKLLQQQLEELGVDPDSALDADTLQALLDRVSQSYTDGVSQTLQKQLDKLDESLEAERRGSQAKSVFLSNMSHELRTPLNSIIGFSDLMLYDGEQLSIDHQEYLEEISSAGKHLLELINEVLDLSRIEAGRVEISEEALNLAEVISDCLTLLNPLASQNRVALNVSGRVDFTVTADRTRLKQVLINLVSNAIKYNRVDGSGRVEVRTETAGQAFLHIHIRDNGHGIAEDGLARLFEPFARFDSHASTIEGSGIGLVIARKLAELMGGAIRVESRVGSGSTFTLTLPRAGAVLSPSEDHAATENREEGEGLQRQILYIEDNPANMRVMNQVISRHTSHQMIGAGLPEEGIQLAQEYRPDLVLCDINLPGMDGFEVLSQLKQNALTREIPVIAVSANAMPESVSRGLSAGFAAYITKPINITVFLEKLNEQLENRPSG